jgi:hypothetical protein
MYHIIKVFGCTYPQLIGPFSNFKEMLAYAKRMEIRNEDCMFYLKLNPEALGPQVSSFTSYDLNN